MKLWNSSLENGILTKFPLYIPKLNPISSEILKWISLSHILFAVKADSVFRPYPLSILSYISQMFMEDLLCAWKTPLGRPWGYTVEQSIALTTRSLERLKRKWRGEDSSLRLQGDNKEDLTYISAILREHRTIARHRKRKEWSWQREQSGERSENVTGDWAVSFTCNSSLLLCLHIQNVSVPPHHSFWTKEPRYLSTQSSYHIVEKLPRLFFSLVFNSINI